MDNHEQKKTLMIWSIGIVMFLVLFFWFFNLRSIISANQSKNKSSFDWTDFKTQMNKNIDDIGNELSALDKKQKDQTAAEATQKLDLIAASLKEKASSTSGLATSSLEIATSTNLLR
jgi:hypothetical protein